MYTEALSIMTRQLIFQTGFPTYWKTSIGSWLSNGLAVKMKPPSLYRLLSRVTGRPNGQPLYTPDYGARLFTFLHQGSGNLEAAKEPRIYLNDPKGITRG